MEICCKEWLVSFRRIISRLLSLMQTHCSLEVSGWGRDSKVIFFNLFVVLCFDKKGWDNTTLNSTGTVTTFSSIAVSRQDGNHLNHWRRICFEETPSKARDDKHGSVQESVSESEASSASSDISNWFLRLSIREWSFFGHQCAMALCQTHEQIYTQTHEHPLSLFYILIVRDW